MNKVAVLLAVLTGLACITYSLQYVTEPICFGRICPAGTASCKELKQSSSDKKRIEIKISCLDETDASITDFFFEETSALDPHTTYRKTRYESANEGMSQAADPYRSQTLDLTPYYGNREYF